HDLSHLKRADPKRRRSSTIVLLTVTDALGRTSSTSQEITVIPDLAPKTSFEVGPTHLIGQDDVTLTPHAFDPDRTVSIVEEDWDQTGDGAPDLVCKAFAGCTAVDAREQVALTMGSGSSRSTRAATPKTKSKPTVTTTGKPTSVTTVTPKAEVAFQSA